MNSAVLKERVIKHRDNPTAYDQIIGVPHIGFVFSSNVTNYFHLLTGEASKHLFALLLHLFNVYPGHVYWVKSDLAEKYNCSERSIYSGIDQLIELGVIFRSDAPNIYWINFNVFNSTNVKPNGTG